MLLELSSCYFDSRHVTWMIVMPLRFYFHSMQSQVNIKLEYKRNWMTVINEMTYMYGFYTSLKN